jgi:gluconate 5-dehydrogenase
VNRIEEQLGAIDVLVNNARIQHRAPFLEFPAEKFDAIMRSNVYAPFFVAHSVARGMTARARGSIINICSVQSELGRPSIVPYTASKGAMKMMTKAMAPSSVRRAYESTDSHPVISVLTSTKP